MAMTSSTGARHTFVCWVDTVRIGLCVMCGCVCHDVGVPVLGIRFVCWVDTVRIDFCVVWGCVCMYVRECPACF